MATFRLRLKTDNPAFKGAAPAEVARILRQLAEAMTSTNAMPGRISLYDVNGLRVGFVETIY